MTDDKEKKVQKLSDKLLSRWLQILGLGWVLFLGVAAVLLILSLIVG